MSCPHLVYVVLDLVLVHVHVEEDVLGEVDGLYVVVHGALAAELDEVVADDAGGELEGHLRRIK